MKSLGRELLTESIKENISGSRIMKEYVNVANQGQRLFVGSGTGLSEAEEAQIREMTASLYEDREEEFHDLGKDFDPKRVDESQGGDTVAPMKEDYQGWSNYETWSVVLILVNNQGDHEYMREIASEAMESSGGDRDTALSELADRIKDIIEEGNPLQDADESKTLYSQLLQGAIDSVNWREVAEHFLSGVEENQAYQSNETPEE